MSYGTSNTPKGYSKPRATATSSSASSRRCQKCGSDQHWSYECKAKPTVQLAVRPSQTQLLKRGIQRQLQTAAPPRTEAEKFRDDLKERADLLEQELRDEKAEKQRAKKPANGNGEVVGEKRPRRDDDDPTDDDDREEQVGSKRTPAGDEEEVVMTATAPSTRKEVNDDELFSSSSEESDKD